MRQQARLLAVAALSSALGILALSCVGCAPTLASRGIQAGVIASAAADLHSTRQALASGAGVEGNFLMQGSDAKRFIWKAAATSAVIWVGTAVEKRGHRVLARLFQGAVATGWFVVSAHNMRVGR